MSNHLLSILSEWKQKQKGKKWALGAVIKTEGPVYRKVGAIMLLSDAGDQLGMLSGGCLEGDILLQSQRALAFNSSTKVTYDSNDEGGLAWKLGIGCGGLAEILIHPCSAENNFLQLPQLHKLLSNNQSARYTLNLNQATAELSTIPNHSARNLSTSAKKIQQASTELLEITMAPPPRLVISGAGVDMQPLSSLASSLGWQVCLFDSRQANARARHFPDAAQVICGSVDELPPEILSGCDALIIANHNLKMDSEALIAAQDSGARYVGLLGPEARRQKVFELSGINPKESVRVAGPMGLALGNDLPESVALSVLAECHAVLFGSDARPLSNHYF